jgi:hypothetical protein
MLIRMLVAGWLIAISGPALAQYVRPVEPPPVRPTAPNPTPVTPVPNLSAPSPLPAAPTVTPAPTVVVPGQPPVAAQGAKRQMRKCWCYARNPASNTSVRTTCEVGCCKGNDSDDRC